MNTDLIRKMASRELARRYFKEDTEINPVSEVLLHKAASAENRQLLNVASQLSGDTLENYEALGGTFRKQAFGTPMFSVGGQQQQPQAAPGVPGMPSAAPKPPAVAKPGQLPGAGASGAGGAGGGIPSIKEPKIPGQNMGQGKMASVKEAVTKEWVGKIVDKALPRASGSRVVSFRTKMHKGRERSFEKLQRHRIGPSGRSAERLHKLYMKAGG
jgi:hypothetical protein